MPLRDRPRAPTVMPMLRLILALLLFATVARAGPLDTLPPETLAKAQAGDPYAAWEAAAVLVNTGLEPDLRAAIPFFTAARDGFRANGGNDRLYEAAAERLLGYVHGALSDYQTALDHYATARELYTVLGHLPETANAIASTYTEQANILNQLSRYDEALALLATARRIILGRTPVDEATLAAGWQNEAIAHEAKGDFDAAVAANAEALALHRRLAGEDSLPVAYIAANIGWLRTRQGMLDEAQDWLEFSEAVILREHGRFHETTMKVQVNLGLVALRAGRTDEAIRYGMLAIPYLQANPGQTLGDQRWTYELLSDAFARKGQTDRAILFGKLAVNAQQALRAGNTRAKGDMAASQEEWRRLYRELADLLIAQGRFSEAQAVLNMEKEEEVFEYLKRDASADLTQTRALLTGAETAQAAALAALPSPVAAERQLRDILAQIDAGTATPEDEDRALALQDALQQATDDFDAQVAAFLAEVPDPATAKAQFDAVGSYQAVLETLPRPTAILQVASLDSGVHLFLTLPGLTLHEVVPAEDLNTRIFATLQAIESVSPDAHLHLMDLYRTLFAPIDPALREAGIEVVMLNLDGALRYVPFAALHDGQGYLVERYAFALYSPTVPTQFTAVPRKPGSTAGFGVTEAHPGFAALPGVRAELATIFDPAPGALDGPTALDGAFTETALKRSLLKRPEVLHIASHFALQPGQEDASFLLLGDGSHLPLSKLRATKALSFRGIDLLTLSACQTARGGDGSEVEGFGATAQLNGAGAVLASLWPVSDAATPRLMRDFYAGMMDEGLDKAEALRRAQAAMLSGGGTVAPGDRTADALAPQTPAAAPGMEHPYAWAAFVLMGNWL